MTYSVIIPVYNAENTIRRCLDSLMNQIGDNAELIIVNDGSTDHCGEICSSYASHHSFIRYFEKENGGVASARNTGLEKATGEYILFVDSDDYVSENYFSVLDTYLQNPYDLLVFGVTVLDGISTSEHPMFLASADSPEKTALLLSNALRRQIMNSLWNKVFRRSILEKYDIRFDNRLAIGEDKVFAVQYAVHVSNVMFIQECLYVASIENPLSLSRRKRADLCDQVLLEHELLFEAVETSVYGCYYRKAVSFSFYRSAYTVISELYKFDCSSWERYRAIITICSRYASKKINEYSNLYHILISLPILWRWVCLIDIILHIKRLV